MPLGGLVESLPLELDRGAECAAAGAGDCEPAGHRDDHHGRLAGRESLLLLLRFGQLGEGELLFLPGSWIHVFQNSAGGSSVGLKYWYAPPGTDLWAV